MAITPEQIGQAVVKAIPGFFNDAIDQLRDGEGAYIRDGMPEGVVAQIGQAVARSACRRYAAEGPDAVGSKGERFERACRPYLDTLNPGDGAGLAVPFQGGQCDAQGYFVVTSWLNDVTEVRSTFNSTVFGPIGGVRIRSDEAGNNNLEIFCRGRRAASSCASLPTTLLPPGWFPIAQSGGDRSAPRVDTVSACGFADICGNPPPEVVPPEVRPDPTPPPFRFNPGPGLDVDINVDLNPDGTISFDFGDGPETVDPFPEDEGGGGGGGGGGDPGDPTDPGAPGAGGDTGPGGDSEGEADPGEELVGVLVEVLQAPQNPNVFSNNSDQPFRGIGYVRMGYPNRLGTDISGGTVISPQFFHAQQRGLTNWAVSANTGFNLRTTPYYRSIEVNV